MNVIYWGEIHWGQKAFGLSFLDFPGCIGSECHPLTLREDASKLLQFHISGMIDDKLTIPKPSGIKMPLIACQQFVGFLPVAVEVPDEIVRGWKK